MIENLAAVTVLAPASDKALAFFRDVLNLSFLDCKCLWESGCFRRSMGGRWDLMQPCNVH